MSTSESISITVSHRGTVHSLSILPDDLLADVHVRLEELTGVPQHLQKLLFKGKSAKDTAGKQVKDTSIKDGMKIQLLGSTTKELDEMHAAETEQQRRERILRERALKGSTKVRTTGVASSETLSYRFHQITPLPHLPNPASALEVLNRLAADPAIQHVMRQHKFSVGVLTELAPHEHPELLGLNENAGQAIKLRLRTNEYDGFRPYREIRRVLCHELTHNVWSDHDNNFKTLNSQLNREVAAFEKAKAEGTHSLTGGDYYIPSDDTLAQVETSHVLGGSSAAASRSGESTEERRRRMLDATMSRLRKEEQVVEDSCGTAGPSATT